MEINQTYKDGVKMTIELEKCLDILEKNGYSREHARVELEAGAVFHTAEAEYKK